MFEFLSRKKVIKEDGDKWKKSGPLLPQDKKGNPLPMALCMVKACVEHYRKFHKPIKTIYLCTRYFVQVEDFCRQHSKEEKADLEFMMLTYDGVEIKKSSPLAVKDMYWDFHEITPPQSAQA